MLSTKDNYAFHNERRNKTMNS